jgi:leader peptidase (prepilin peptidase)/N-methyltransferase
MVLLLFITSSVIAVFVIDLESQLIPDEATFLMFLFVVIALLTNPGIYVYLLSGFGAGLFLLFIHLITKGRGMGLGDVKMVVPLGALLGPRLSVVWIFGAFVIGGLVGIVLLASRSVAWRSRVAFGPFLVVSFFITLFFGSVIASWILPV